MNFKFSAAVGNLLKHFYKHHQVAITEAEIWLMSNILMSSDSIFDNFEMIGDVMGLTLDSIDFEAIIEYHTAIEVLNVAKQLLDTNDRSILN